MWNIERIIKKGEYLYAVVKNHPHATKHGYVLVHRIVIENHLNRLLNANEVVHHLDGDKKNNALSNLMLLTRREHVNLHKEGMKKDLFLFKCPQCSGLFKRPRRRAWYFLSGNSPAFCSRKCSVIFYHYKHLHGETAEMKRAVSENLVCVEEIPYTTTPSKPIDRDA